MSGRKRAYAIMMGTCLTLFVLAWAVVRLYSPLAALVMSAVALAIPPFAAVVANRGADQRDRADDAAERREERERRERRR